MSITAQKTGLVARNHNPELITYFVLAYAITWAIEIPIALSQRGIIPVTVPLSLHYLASIGPLAAALITSAVFAGQDGLKELFSRLTHWRVPREYVLFVLLAPLALFVVAVATSRILDGQWPDLALLGQVDYLPYLGVLPTLLLWLVTFGLCEEVGWRGYALPRLQSQHSAFTSALIIGVIWGFWHTPTFFYRDTYLAMGILVVPMIVFSVTAASFIMTWLFNSTKGSLPVVILFHAVFNFFSASAAAGNAGAIVMGALTVFWAVRVFKVHGKENLASRPRVSE